MQAYFDRWQIEVNHREIQDTLGIGQAQVRNSRSVPRQPATALAAFSALMLAGIQVFGDTRSEAFPALPKWRRNARRPSCLDLIALFRQEVASANGSAPLPGASIGRIWPRLPTVKGTWRTDPDARNSGSIDSLATITYDPDGQMLRLEFRSRAV